MSTVKNINVETLLKDAGNLLLDVIIIYIAYSIAKSLLKKIITTSFDKYSERENVSIGRARTLQGLTTNVISYTLMFVFGLMLLDSFGLDPTPLLASAGIAGLAIGFGAQGLVSDVVTGFFLLLERQIDVDDYITAAGYEGIVEEVGLRTTKVRSFDGTLNYIPNREITSLSNHSRGNMRALVDMSISYNDNIDHAIDIMQQACDKFATENEFVKEGPNVLGVQTFGASDVVIRVIAKTENMQQWAVERDLRKLLKVTLDENGIEIPFPHQVTLYRNETENN
ncbi:mechanosensitive ion channel family protein [Bacillus solimangrovi]|uniref:Mechanosensitive ion channel protein n=1 Tax=Bacillus solimangrovi TaxID=1305675 RepID=A0A1E5LG13_9BACI|nr:mechanosensitive ion channel family protein [Bacillus solimangrovi]OEH93013.1 mechanosensitive ion channel protein [Bacillus solimangrovi]